MNIYLSDHFYIYIYMYESCHAFGHDAFRVLGSRCNQPRAGGAPSNHVCYFSEGQCFVSEIVRKFWANEPR